VPNASAVIPHTFRWLRLTRRNISRCSTGPVQIGTQVSETIKTLRADYNSVVKKGEIRAALEPRCPTQVDQGRATVTQLLLQAQRESGS
jgi:hypothetical protein